MVKYAATFNAIPYYWSLDDQIFCMFLSYCVTAFIKAKNVMIFALDIMGVLLLSFWRKNHLNGDGVFRGHKTRDGSEAWKYRYHVFLCFGLELCKKFTWNLDQPYTNTFFYPTTFYFMYVVRTYNHHFTKYTVV